MRVNGEPFFVFSAIWNAEIWAKESKASGPFGCYVNNRPGPISRIELKQYSGVWLAGHAGFLGSSTRYTAEEVLIDA